MSYEDGSENFVAVLALFLGIVIGIAVGRNITKDIYQKEAVAKGYAMHDSKTGDWHWSCDTNKISQ